jgi:hypothetical protein
LKKKKKRKKHRKKGKREEQDHPEGQGMQQPDKERIIENL